MADTQRYHAGQKAEATLDFLGGERVERITAIFAHADDPDEKFEISGIPTEQVASEGRGYTYWQATLSGDVTVENRPGTYHCETVEASYPGGRKVSFSGLPDIRLDITEEDIQSPESLGWRWSTP